MAFELSPRNTLRFDFTNYNTSYSGGDLVVPDRLQGQVLTTTLQRNVDERTQVAAVMTIEDYKADVNTNDFRTVTLTGTFQRPINPLWSFNMGAGVLRSDYTVVNLLNQATTGATTDYVITVGFTKRSERTNINSIWARRVSELQRVCHREASDPFAVNREFTQRLEMDVGFSLQESETLDNLNSTDNRNYGTVSMECNWAIKPVLFLVAGLEYWTQEYPDDILNRGQ